MKRKLLYLTTIVLFSAFSTINAQTTVWNFSIAADWPPSVIPPATTPVTPQESYYLTETVVNKLGIVPGPSTVKNFGTVNQSNAVFPSPNDFTGTYRFQMNGAGYTQATGFVFTPVQRYLYFTADDACTVKIWFKTGSNNSVRTIFVTDGTQTIASGTSNSGGNTDFVVFTANVTAAQAAGKIYIFGDAANNLYKIEVSGANVTTPSLGVDGFKADAASNVFSNGKLVFVSNVKSDTKVDVYGISGVLVKSFTTGSDTSFDLNTGLYVVKSKSAEGEKSAKVLIN